MDNIKKIGTKPHNPSCANIRNYLDIITINEYLCKMKQFLKWGTLGALIALAGYLIVFTAVDAHLMGVAIPCFSFSVDKDSYIIGDSTRVELQNGLKCSAYSSAYVLRHWGTDAHGDSIYDIMPDKMDGAYVYPRGIVSLLKFNGFKIDYHMGNLAALKNEIAKGHPVIVMIKINPDRDWLHYVPVVGYTSDSIFIAESLPELSNANGENFNRRIATEDFKTLWNTSSFRMPLYRNTFIIATR